MNQTAMVERSSKARLAPVLCALCQHPVSHMDQGVQGARAGGLCTRCRRGKDGKPREVYTFEVVVDHP
jgi:hypothetical protein